ncbi:MAG: septum formation initiator family protein, partial [Micrococcus sp.]|nr:septum formation initiator family protein [Micrococcus sp.]
QDTAPAVPDDAEAAASGDVIAAEADPAQRRREQAALIAQEPDATVSWLKPPTRSTEPVDAASESADGTTDAVVPAHSSRRHRTSRQRAETRGGRADTPRTRPEPHRRRAKPQRSRAEGQRSRAEQQRERQASARARRREPAPAPVPARSLTGRTLLVVVILFAAISVMAPHLRLFLNQQLELTAAREDIAAQEQRREDLQEQIQRWDDPEFVRQQARQRLELVMPGETLYMVTGTGEVAQAEEEQSSVLEDPVNERLPWAEGLWDSVVRAATE